MTHRTEERSLLLDFLPEDAAPSAAPRGSAIVRLAEMVNGQEGDLFVLMTAKEELTTREHKPYCKVGFRDDRREVTFPVWSDSTWGPDCKANWQVGAFYKLRAVYRETSFGPQLDIRKLRPVVEADAADGFDPLMCLARSRFQPAVMFEELLEIARRRIENPALRDLVVDILEQNGASLLALPAATHNHHAFVGGYLEHVLSVTRTCVDLAEKYADYYPDLRPPLDKGLVVAGGILHDVGKLREIEQHPEGAQYTASGDLIGHLLQGRDIVREAAAGRDLGGDTLLRLEHIIVAHQRLPEWGSPKPPMTPEALIVHYADDLDAKFNMMHAALRDASGSGPCTSKKNPLYQKVYRGVRDDSPPG